MKRLYYYKHYFAPVYIRGELVVGMDLSNLRTSLREEEASSLRRTAHLRAAEDELNSYFRASAVSLTTLYRQGVAGAKASYEKGYAHALAHVLELCDRDRDWLKGYLQRRIEALEATADDAADDAQGQDQIQGQGAPTHAQGTEELRLHSLDQAVVNAESGTHSSKLIPASTPLQRANSTGQSSTNHSSNKRSRSVFAQHYHESPETNDSPHSTQRMLHPPSSCSPSSSSLSRFPQPSASTSAFGSCAFNFTAPTSLPPFASPASGGTLSSSTKPAMGGVIKTSNPAKSRRRLHKLKGLRPGRQRMIELSPSHHDQPDDEILLPPSTTCSSNNNDDAWTDDESSTPDPSCHPTSLGAPPTSATKVVAWSERNLSHDSPKTLERLDRRKRRKTPRLPIPSQSQSIHSDQDLPDSSLTHPHEFVYHS